MSGVITKLVIPFRMVALVEQSSYFAFGFVCARALAATDLVFGLVRPLRNNAEALRATGRDVCFEFAFATGFTSSLVRQ